MNLEAKIRLSGLDRLMSEYLLSLSFCQHGQKPSQCATCNKIGVEQGLWAKFLIDCPFARSLTGNELQLFYDEWNDERLYRIRRYFAQNKVVHFDPLAYRPMNEARTTVAQSADRRPLRFGGNDRVLSDQNKFGSRSERASQKHHELSPNGEKRLHKFYGAAEQIYDKSKPVYKNKLVGNRIRARFAGNYHPAPDTTPIPKGDHYMERTK